MSDIDDLFGDLVSKIESLQERVSLLERLEDNVADFLIDVANGLIPGYSVVSKFGRNPDIDLGAAEDIWTVGGIRTWLSAAATLEAISTSINDTSGGSGAQIITVQGLDGSFLEVEEDITMNGTSATSATSNSFIRVNRAFVKQVGTYRGNNEGDITIRISGGGATQTNILTAIGQTEQTHYTIPANKDALLMMMYTSVDSTRTATPTLYQIPGADDVSAPYVGALRKVFGLTALNVDEDHKYEAYPKLTGPTDIFWRATVSANNTAVEAGFDLLLMDK